jgi:hypothetical protein
VIASCAEIPAHQGKITRSRRLRNMHLQVQPIPLVWASDYSFIWVSRERESHPLLAITCVKCLFEYAEASIHRPLGCLYSVWQIAEPKHDELAYLTDESFV